MLQVIEAAVLEQFEHEAGKKEERAKLEAAQHHANPLFSKGTIGMKSTTGKSFSAPRGHSEKPPVFSEGDDWQVQFDFETVERACRPFPPQIAIVSGKGSCPDGVMWSMETQTVGLSPLAESFFHQVLWFFLLPP